MSIRYLWLSECFFYGTYLDVSLSGMKGPKKQTATRPSADISKPFCSTSDTKSHITLDSGGRRWCLCQRQWYDFL